MSIIGVFISTPGIAALIIGNKMVAYDVRSYYILFASMGGFFCAVVIFTVWHEMYPGGVRDERFGVDVPKYWRVVWLCTTASWCMTLLIKLVGWGVRTYMCSCETDGYWDPKTFSTGLVGMMAISPLLAFFVLCYMAYMDDRINEEYKEGSCCCIRRVKVDKDLEAGEEISLIT